MLVVCVSLSVLCLRVGCWISIFLICLVVRLFRFSWCWIIIVMFSVIWFGRFGCVSIVCWC